MQSVIADEKSARQFIEPAGLIGKVILARHAISAVTRAIAMKGRCMRIENLRTLNGANLYHDAPVLVMTLNLEEMAGKETHEVTGFMDQLLTLLPGIKQHHCVNGRMGDRVKQIQMTLGFGQITARVALELATLVGIPVHYANTFTAAQERRCIVIEFTNEAGMRFLLRTAVELVDALIRGETPPLEERLAEARDLIRGAGPSHRSSVGMAAHWL